MSIKSMDDLPDVEHTFEFRVGLAEILVPERRARHHREWCMAAQPAVLYCNHITPEKEVDRDL